MIKLIFVRELKINGSLIIIIIIIAKIINGISLTIDKLIFNQNSGEKINYNEICINEKLIDIKEQMKMEILDFYKN